ncbi:MAG: hypothetical protein WDN24_06560 [Sphingomonas sp.]
MRIFDGFLVAAGLALAAGATASLAQPDGAKIVTACGRDDAGGGLNLITALAGGGKIVIRCADGQGRIAITRTHVLSGGTQIDGEGRVTLTGDGTASFFEIQGELALSNLTVRNGGPTPPADVSDLRTAIVAGQDAFVTLVKVRTERTATPYSVARLEASDSIFEANGIAGRHPVRGIIEAEHILLRRTQFNGNLSNPIVGGRSASSGRTALSRTVGIEDSLFSGNQAPLILHDAKVSIRGTRFEGNGAEGTDGSWGCCAGALTLVHSDATIIGSTFTANRSSGFGGAIQAIGTTLRISGTGFERNRARIGGAILFWGWPLRDNIWSGTALPDAPRLGLDRVRFNENQAEFFGGALATAGPVDGDTVLFAGNRAGRRGGAVAGHGLDEAPPGAFSGVMRALEDQTVPAADSLSFARATFVDNRAGVQGAALDGGKAALPLGKRSGRPQWCRRGIVRCRDDPWRPDRNRQFDHRGQWKRGPFRDRRRTRGAGQRHSHGQRKRELRPPGGTGRHRIEHAISRCHLRRGNACRRSRLASDFSLGTFSAARTSGETSACAHPPRARGRSLRQCPPELRHLRPGRDRTRSNARVGRRVALWARSGLAVAVALLVHPDPIRARLHHDQSLAHAGRSGRRSDRRPLVGDDVRRAAEAAGAGAGGGKGPQVTVADPDWLDMLR